MLLGCARKLEKTAGMERTNNLQPHKLGLEWMCDLPKQSASTRGLSTEILLRLHLPKKHGGGTEVQNTTDVFLTNQCSLTHSPISHDSQECGKPLPRVDGGGWHWSGDELALLSWFRPDGLKSPARPFRSFITGGRFRTALEQLKGATGVPLRWRDWPIWGCFFHGLEPCFQLFCLLFKSAKYC